MDPNDVSLAGTVTGNYRVLSRIGTGTMGHVYEAERVQLGTHVALKVLHRHHDEELAARFLREGKTLRLLEHRNIVELIDMGQLEDGSLYLATELIRGMSLRQLMDGGPVDPRRALGIIRQVLDALDAAHALGVVHRDIKPENIMIGADDGRDVVKVLDFGVAKLLADTIAGLGEANLTSIGFSIFGSAPYIAPESVVGQPVDARIDLYSVGALLYELLAGRPPYDDEDPTVILRHHAFSPIPSLQQGAPDRIFTPELEDLVSHALAKQPDARFRNAAEMTTALDAAVRSLEAPTAAPPVPSDARSPEPEHHTGVQSPEPERRNAVRVAWTWFRGGTRKRRLVIAASAVAAVVVVMAIAARSGGSQGKAPERGSDLGARAKALVAAGKHSLAADLIERELVGPAKREDGAALLVLGHARFALGRRLEALGAYERALRVMPDLATDKDLHANLKSVLDTNDSLAIVLALELLAALAPPDDEAVVSYASSGKLADARRLAFMLAERDNVADRVDRIGSWSLDLQQASSCDERKAIIAKLAATSDRRALAALKRARTAKCVEREATEAIARIESAK